MKLLKAGPMLLDVFLCSLCGTWLTLCWICEVNQVPGKMSSTKCFLLEEQVPPSYSLSQCLPAHNFHTLFCTDPETVIVLSGK